MLSVITPIPAGLHGRTVQTKTRPIMFDRTPAGEIIVPGGWWELMFEQVTQDKSAAPALRQMAATVAATVGCEDALLPGNTDTIEISVGDPAGNVISHEASGSGRPRSIRHVVT